MHITIPRALCHISDVTNMEDGPVSYMYREQRPPMTRYTLYRGVYTSDDAMEIDEKSYFYDTDHQPLNDCVHSKRLVDGKWEAPTLLVGSEYYRSRAYDYRGSLSELKHGDFPDGVRLSPIWTMQSMPRDMFINKGDLSWKIQLSAPQAARNNRSSYWDVTIDFYDACQAKEWTQNKPKVFWRSARIRIPYINNYTDIRIEIPDPLETRVFYRYYSFAWAEPTGQYQLYNLAGPKQGWDEIANILIANIMRYQTLYYGAPSWVFVGWFTGATSISEGIFSEIGDVLESWGLSGYMSRYSGWRSYDYLATTGVLIPEPPPFWKRFLLHEDARIVEGIDAYLLSTDTTNYWHGLLVNEAYLDALNSVPRLNDNSISNILELVGFIKALVVDHRIEIPKSLGDVWLSYRYVYSTSKLDAEEAIEFVHRHRDLGTLDQWIHCFGVSRREISFNGFTTLATCRCGLEIRPRDVAMLGKVWRALYTYGLQPNFYVVWDSLPYSFIVDWIIPIGNMARALDAQSMYNGTYYDIKDVVFSISYNIEDEYLNTYRQYSRWVSKGLPSLNGFYFLEEDPASSKVVGMRILDSLSLFIGKVKK